MEGKFFFIISLFIFSSVNSYNQSLIKETYNGCYESHIDCRKQCVRNLLSKEKVQLELLKECMEKCDKCQYDYSKNKHDIKYKERKKYFNY